MFDKTQYTCVRCGARLSELYEEAAVYECPECSARFRALVDDQSGSTALIDQRARKIPEPLYLPKGSIRATATLTMALSCWVLILAGHDVPAYLFSLLLAILGYYFGFRAKMKAAQSRLVDAAADTQEPLFLPAGAIRTLLILGFLACAFALYRRGQLFGPNLKYVEFFAVLAGLVAGHVFGRFLNKTTGSPTVIFINHAKGLFVLAVCAVLAYLFLTGTHAHHPRESMLLCAAISFYFGSRT